MTTTPANPAFNLRALYFTRSLVQVLWAASVLFTATSRPALAGLLLIVYPLWDVACTVYDLRNSALEGSAKTSQTINAVLGTATAIGIALTIFRQPAYAIAIFGLWALGAGLLQFAAGLIRRRQMGGQWAMILSGLQSTAAGVAFVLGGLHEKLHVKDLGGYAVFGAVYFLIAGILLTRRLSRVSVA